MKRRNLLRNGLFATAGATVLGPLTGIGAQATPVTVAAKRAKNIIFMVSDGMSQGTLTMADQFLRQRDGIHSHWIQLYRDGRLVRSLMDTSSADSLVTDSAAGGSAWGGGMRVQNGKLNVGPKGERPMPILQKFKKAGKKVGCVTTVPITHATPASFCVNNDSRKSQPEIAAQYMDLRFDVMMGGGLEYFTSEGREDKRDLLKAYREAGFAVALNKTELAAAKADVPLMAVFHNDALPYTVDHLSSNAHKTNIPSLAQMTSFAIERMKGSANGFAMQVEGGKVDWAAHGNDVAGLIYDQIAFDEAVKIAIDFAEKDGETLVITTTDHGNANPGLFYGKTANANFDRVQRFHQSNAWLMGKMLEGLTAAQVTELVTEMQAWTPTTDEADLLVKAFASLSAEDRIKPEKQPFGPLAMMQRAHTSVNFGSDNHSSDLVELAAFGPGSELLKHFTINTELHTLMLKAAQMPEEYFKVD
jgi:alkaline phosphatase